MNPTTERINHFKQSAATFWNERNKREQEGIIAQIAQQTVEGRQPIAAFDDQLDGEREELEQLLASAPSMDKPTYDAERLAALRDKINEGTVSPVVHAMFK